MAKKFKEPSSVHEDYTHIQYFHVDEFSDDSPVASSDEDKDDDTLPSDDDVQMITELGGQPFQPVDIDGESKVININNIIENYSSAFYDLFNVRTPTQNKAPLMVGGSIDHHGDINLEVDLCGAHRIVKADVTILNSNSIILPCSFIDKVNVQLKSMGASKVQFGIVTEWEKNGEYRL